MWESIFLINQTKVKEIPPPNKEKNHTHQKQKNKTPKKNLNKKTQLNLH